jgi:hypothetical protein
MLLFNYVFVTTASSSSSISLLRRSLIPPLHCHPGHRCRPRQGIRSHRCRRRPPCALLLLLLVAES